MPKTASISKANQDSRMVLHRHSPRQQAQPLISSPANKKRTAATVSGGNSVNTCLVEPNAPPQNSGANNINR